MKLFPHHVFREYDIRGIASSEITPELGYRLGVAFAATLAEGEQRAVVVGRDVRLSGPELQQAVMQGLNDAGINVLDMGMGPTPLAYYTVFQLDAAGCIQVTASHNPASHNGFKIMRGRDSLHGHEIQALKTLMQQPYTKADRSGVINPIDLCKPYHDFVLFDCPLARPLKVVIDAGNGPSGIIAAPIYRSLGCEVIELYCDPDGTFPNHHPDPTIEENLRDLAALVRSQQADIGIGFDGDGDRIGIVDEQGKMVAGDLLLLLLSQQLLLRHPGATIISEAKSSQHLYQGIKAAGGKGIMWRTGHSLIKAKMKESGALLAGEMNGHLFFADRFFGFDDAVYAGARIMQMLAEKSSPISAMVAALPHSETTPEIRVSFADEKKFQLIEEAKTYFESKGYQINSVDGLRIQFGNGEQDWGWGLLRASNTEAAIVLRFEAANAPRLQQIRSIIEGWLEKALTDI
ncbi:MAG: phosphomannomutase/phosphoglucomutase [Mariprofundus sp.]|nr:phosphomannomutase/phosphoglucomutase [Mariprofundus sp.]